MKKIADKLYMYRFYFLFFTIILNFFTPPLSTFPFIKIAFKLFTLTIMLLSAANFIQKDKQHLRYAWFIFGFINIGVAFYFYLFPGTVIEMAQYILLLLFFFVITVSLLKQIFAIKEVTVDVIVGSFCGYILVGITSYFLFMLIDISSPGSLSGLSNDFNERTAQLFYFAFTCLTTLGFGDIIPVSNISQKLSVFTAAVGQFYIAIVVAILVSRFMHISTQRSTEK